MKECVDLEGGSNSDDDLKHLNERKNDEDGKFLEGLPRKAHIFCGMLLVPVQVQEHLQIMVPATSQ